MFNLTTLQSFKVVKMHVEAEENVSANNSENNKRKLRATVLDNFTKLTNNQLNVRIKSGTSLVKYWGEQEKSENGEFEVKYALKRLIRGLGSSNANTRSGFYSTLVALLKTDEELDIQEIFDIINEELHTSSTNSKGEKGEIYCGQVLTCGAIIKSDLFIKGTTQEQAKVVEILLNAGNARSYLTILSNAFLKDILEQIDKNKLQEVILPSLKLQFSKPLNELSQDKLCMLLLIRTANFEGSKKVLKELIGTSKIFSEENLQIFCDNLVSTSVTNLQHPIYELFSKSLVTTPHLITFLTLMDASLARKHRNKQILSTIILKYILNNLTDSTLIPQVLLPNFVRNTLNYFKEFTGKQRDDEYQKAAREFFEAILNSLKKDGVSSEIKLEVLEKLLFNPGTFHFEKVTKSKLPQQILMLLDAESIKLFAETYREVVLGTKAKENSWFNSDRLYAAQMLVKLFSYPQMQTENEWKTEQLIFLLNLCIIKNEQYSNVGHDLLVSLKETFFRALDLKLLKLDDLRHILSQLVQAINSRLTSENLETALRQPVTEETYEIWKKTVELTDKLNKKSSAKKSSTKVVFHLLFLHLALQLFNDVKLATDSLKELFSCYERYKSGKKEEKTHEEDPLWIEVVIDLFLNLLSRNSHLLRTMINGVFPHLCAHLNATALHQLLSVLDPKNEDNPLAEESDSESEQSESENEEEESENEQSETDEEENETANDKLRMAVRQALGTNGYQTDEESVDVDDIGEEEGRKLDEALAEAFKQFKPNRGRKSAKQTKEEEALTHFRLRVLDLIEIYLDSTPSLSLCLEIMLPLLQTLELCVKDERQKPLNVRVRSCLKKLTNLKKFGPTEDVTETVLGDLLKSLLDKSDKSALVMQEMGDKIAECCTFVIKSVQVLQTAESTPKKTKKKVVKTVDEILKTELETFFEKRDSLTPYVLFRSVFQMNWENSFDLIPLLINFAFDENVRPFRRNQALDLLKICFMNHRFLIANKEPFQASFNEYGAALTQKVLNLFSDVSAKLKEKFFCNLFGALTAIKRSPFDQSTIDWKKIGELVTEYRTKVSFSKDAKIAFKNLCNSLGVSSQVQTTNPQKKINVNSSNGNGNEAKQQEKKMKKKANNKLKRKLKKEAKLLRMHSSSEGLLNGFSFANSNLKEEKFGNGIDQEMNDDEQHSENSLETGSMKKKRKANGIQNKGKKVKTN